MSPDPSDAENRENAAGRSGVGEAIDELEELVDSPTERAQVREARRALVRARPRPFGRLRSSFGLRDAGEAFVGSFVFGVPMVVEEGTLEVGAFIATRPALAALTGLLGLAAVLGILRAVEFGKVEEDLLFGLVPVRLLGVIVVAAVTATALMTAWTSFSQLYRSLSES